MKKTIYEKETFMKNEKISKNSITRRDFLIRLGTGTAALAITGFFTFDAIGAVVDDNPKNTSEVNSSNKPKLSKNIKIDSENDQLVLCGENAKCSVNKTGEKIIELLDGKHTLSNIASEISDYYAIEYTEALEVSIASFICQLGSVGFLSAPFYVTMYEA